MSRILIAGIFFSLFHPIFGAAQRSYGDEYLGRWKAFYPSQAVRKGMHDAVFSYESPDTARISGWMAYNQDLIRELADPNNLYVQSQGIDARLLLMQARREVHRWERQAPHLYDVDWYLQLIADAVPQVAEADYLTVREKSELICQRLKRVEELGMSARTTLRGGPRQKLEKGLDRIERLAVEFRGGLARRVADLPVCASFAGLCEAAARSLDALAAHVRNELLPAAAEDTSGAILGPERYAEELRLYTDADLQPAKLAEMALQEIHLVRRLMQERAAAYLSKTYPGRALPQDFGDQLDLALADMEKDAPKSGAEYLEFWRKLSDDAAAFVAEQGLATLPDYQTLRILPAPESAGPAARIGWVASSPPFAPNPLTTLYLPSIPDTLPVQEQMDFWASFNKPFNRFIVIHELFPGHYMQNKIIRETAHPVRLLFPYGPYSEGWATFCEKVAIDAGWEAGADLTLLAQLRKRLENANRAYTSVMVHCEDWDEEQVMTFSTETSLLAPQFAKSLWGRLLRGPMQMTSYFYGGVLFKDLLAREKERLGPDFDLKHFMDTILRAGPIPIDEFPALFGL